LKKISIGFFLLLTCLTSYSQSAGKITVKKQEQLFFYRLSNDSSGTIVKNNSDKFLIQMSVDFKGVMVFSITNGSFLKTEQDNVYQLIHMPGLKYRGYFPSDEKNRVNMKPPNSSITFKEELKMEIDGASHGSNNEIIIEIQNIKTEKVLLTNKFVFQAK
jgi:hypothetical protein